MDTNAYWNDKYSLGASHNDDEDGRKNRVSTDERTQLLSSKKPQSQSKHSKGVAMSFGFKRRPTPMTANPVPISRNAENSGTSTNDPNGNKDETFDFAIGNQTGKGRITPKQTSQKPTSNNPRPSRFGFHQGTTDRTNKVADIKTAPSPVEFGGPFQNTNRSRLTSPTTESDNIISNDRRTGTFTRNAPKRETVERLTSPIGETDTSKDRRPKTARHFSKTETVEKLPSTTTEPELLNYERRYRAFTRNGTKPETAERRKVVITDNNDNTAALKNRLEGAQAQMGKFTFQTTRLPQPEPIRVIETKTAKTIANNNKRSARIRQQFEEGSAKTEDDSGFGSNTSYLGENDPVTNFRYSDARVDDNRIQHRINALNLMENSDSFSETGTPPPLPELPSVFRTPRSIITEKGYGFSEKSDGKRPLIKLGSQRTFLKSRATETDSNPPSPSEHDWSNAGEAMAEDSILIASAQHKICAANDIIKDHFVSTCATVVEAALQTLVKPSISLQLTQNFQPTQKITLLDEDPNFTAVATNNKTGHLLDEEILSPVESLLSCSETEEILLKKKMTHSSSNSKDINEKLTAASPETPSNGTYSLSSDDKALSLSDDKEDFLIDDEIADQPELVFEDTINNVDNTSFNYNSDKISVIIEQDSMRNPRARGYEIEASPLSSRRRRDFLRSITGSIDSLSPCESIASDDLMMEFDISHSNDIDSCDRRSGSFSSFDDTSKFRFKTDDKTLANKNLFKSTASKPIALSHAPETPNYIKDSPRLLRRTFSNHQSSPEHNRSPKNNSLHQLRFNSMTYDPTSDCLTLTKANHSAIQQDIIGIKTMLLTLKRVLNESETRNLLNNDAQVACPYYENDSIQNHNNNNEFKVELADLRRQVIFLQGQLEDKETMVDNLQKQIDCYANQNIHLVVDTPLLQLDIQNRCNAATQTDRIRPISSGSLTFSGSSMDDSGSLVRYTKPTLLIQNNIRKTIKNLAKQELNNINVRELLVITLSNHRSTLRKLDEWEASETFCGSRSRCSRGWPLGFDYTLICVLKF